MLTNQLQTNGKHHQKRHGVGEAAEGTLGPATDEHKSKRHQQQPRRVRQQICGEGEKSKKGGAERVVKIFSAAFCRCFRAMMLLSITKCNTLHHTNRFPQWCAHLLPHKRGVEILRGSVGTCCLQNVPDGRHRRKGRFQRNRPGHISAKSE